VSLSHEPKTVPSGASLAAGTADEEAVGPAETGRLLIGRRFGNLPHKCVNRVYTPQVGYCSGAFFRSRSMRLM
jgi:hypothetical protein